MTFRLIFLSVLIFSVVFMPIWVSAILGLLGMVYFPFLIEACFIFLLSDLLFGVQEARLRGIIFLSFLISIIALIMIEFLKKKLKFYRQ